MEQGAHWLAYYTDQGIEAQQTRTTERPTHMDADTVLRYTEQGHVNIDINRQIQTS